MTEPAPPSRPASKWQNRIKWLAPIALALFVVCSGCFMLFAFALTARTELEAPILGSDWRVWQLRQPGTNGIGVSQSSGFVAEGGQACRRVRVWLITWRPSLQVESSEYDDCEFAGWRYAPVAQARRSAIIESKGDRL